MSPPRFVQGRRVGRDRRSAPARRAAEFVRFKVCKIAYLAEHMRCRDQLAEMIDQSHQQVKVLIGEPRGALRGLNPPAVDAAGDKQHQQIRVDQNASPAMFLQQRLSVQHLGVCETPDLHGHDLTRVLANNEGFVFALGVRRLERRKTFRGICADRAQRDAPDFRAVVTPGFDLFELKASGALLAQCVSSEVDRGPGGFLN